MTESMVNASTAAQEKLQCESLDHLVELARLLRGSVEASLCMQHVCGSSLALCHCKGPLGLLKADIDSAFRRLPIEPEHRNLAHVAFRAEGVTKVFGHNAMPFGAIASVHAWDRIGMQFVFVWAWRVLMCRLVACRKSALHHGKKDLEATDAQVCR